MSGGRGSVRRPRTGSLSCARCHQQGGSVGLVLDEEGTMLCRKCKTAAEQRRQRPGGSHATSRQGEPETNDAA